MKLLRYLISKIKNAFYRKHFYNSKNYNPGSFICGPGNYDYGRDTPEIRKQKLEKFIKQRNKIIK